MSGGKELLTSVDLAHIDGLETTIVELFGLLP